ncbi:TNF receptor-associated factor 3 [Exaiptasia diaphana]|uniref:MATH domain-containing protein n=1 Tax=Exaiptasia diaphana TaxID=2652724 RepID=A0A913Y1R3_EXADI|nr:TNF receptor-associated factor 3 [Exaiptasia diaphana]XP_020913415.1 TNF receptor-associated factor 3 [Exaiptasia diaphana]KXJ07286.1 TNF receptor-associated factor 3 [Exaiptasia diaphana]
MVGSKKITTVENDLCEAKQEAKHNENLRAAIDSKTEDVEREVEENSRQIRQILNATDHAHTNDGPEVHQDIRKEVEDQRTRLDAGVLSIHQNAPTGQVATASGGGVNVDQNPSDIEKHANDNADEDDDQIPFSVMCSSDEEQQSFNEEASKKEPEVGNEAIKRQLDRHEAFLSDQKRKVSSLHHGHDGTYIWKIYDFSRRQQEAAAGNTLSVCSPKFRVGRFGYTFCVVLYPNGESTGTGTHLSLSFVIMKGDGDNFVPWPFRQEVTFELLDPQDDRNTVTDSFCPDPNSSSFQKPTSSMNIARGCPRFVSQENLQKGSSYIDDDTIYIKIKIDTSGL